MIIDTASNAEVLLWLRLITLSSGMKNYMRSTLVSAFNAEVALAARCKKNCSSYRKLYRENNNTYSLKQPVLYIRIQESKKILSLKR
ncbi:hypothetical protein D3Z36_02390 [Lachnospiraceae bacterium]|nr:hypothetical protein [Lachnospiraceae bacterium]